MGGGKDFAGDVNRNKYTSVFVDPCTSFWTCQCFPPLSRIPLPYFLTKIRQNVNVSSDFIHSPPPISTSVCLYLQCIIAYLCRIDAKSDSFLSSWLESLRLSRPYARFSFDVRNKRSRFTEQDGACDDKICPSPHPKKKLLFRSAKSFSDKQQYRILITRPCLF